VAWHAPPLIDRTVAAVSAGVELVEATAAIGDWMHALLAVVEIVVLALPSLGLLFFLVVLARVAARLVWRERRAASPPARTRPEPAPTEPSAAAVSLKAAIEDHFELKRRRSQRDHAAAISPASPCAEVSDLAAITDGAPTRRACRTRGFG